MKSKSFWVEIIIFLAAGFGSMYILDIGLWSFLVAVLAAAAYRTLLQGKSQNDDE
jgi:hypothetical protein